MSSSDDECDSQGSDSVSVHESFLPEWQGDEVACEMCGDAGGAASLVICENVDRGCIGARHTYCFDPVREEVPEDEPWHCHFCSEHGFDQQPYAPAGIGVADTAGASPPVSLAQDSETPEADSAPLPSASSPSAPGSSDSPAGSRDSAAAAEEAQTRAAVVAEVAAEAAAEGGSSGEDAPAAAGAAPAAKRQAAIQQQEAVQRLARTSSDKVSAEAIADGSAQLSGSRQEQSAQQSAKILPAKRKADAVAAAPKLHDGWAKLAKLDAGSIKAPTASASAAAGAAQPLPRLPPLRTGSTPKPQPGSIPDRKDPRMSSAATAAVSRNGDTSAQRTTGGLAPDGSRAGPLSRLQDDDSVFGASSPRSPAAGSAAASQPARAAPGVPAAKPAQSSGTSAGAPQQQQQRRPPARPGGGGSAPGGPPRPQQPPPAQQQRRPDALRPTGQVRGEGGGQAGSGVPPTLEQPRRPPPSTINVFASIMSDMQSKAKEFNAHEEELRQQTEERKEHEHKALDAERKDAAAARGAALWSGAMRVREVPLEADDAAGRGQKQPGEGAPLSPPLHLLAFSLATGADSAAAAAALPAQFEARTVSMDDIDFQYMDAHKGAALVIGANTANAGTVMQVAALCRSLMQRGAALRAELPASKAWLALVPNPPDGSPSLLWGLFVTAGDQPQPQHRHIRPPRSAVKQAARRERRGLRWVDGRRSDARAWQAERGPGPAYGDAAAAASMAAATANRQQGDQSAAQQQQQEAGPPSPTRSRPRPAWHHPGAAGLQDGQQLPDRQRQPGQPAPRQAAPSQQQPQSQLRPEGNAQLADADGAPGGAVPVLPLVTSAAPPANGVPAAAPRLPLRGFRFSVVGYTITQDKTSDVHRALAGARALGAEHYRFPVTPGSINALLLHPQMCQGGLENNQWEFCIKDFILKPPIAFYRGLDYIMLAARLGRRPTPTEAIPCELLACGIAIISDAATLAADPDTLKKLYSTLKRGMMGCKRRRGCAWVVCLSPMEHVRLEDAYRRSHQKEVGQALQMFNSRLPGAGSGPALSARLSEEEVSSKVVADPPQLVRDAVKVAYKRMADCRHVIIASGDRGLVQKAASQATVLACDGLGAALDLITQIVDHLEATCHRPGEPH